jgi:protein-S-isoprenylcysteine O-methyltransferase Ste14
VYENDLVFRLIMIGGFACVFPIGMYHRLKAAKSKEKLDRRQEGIWILATLRPLALLRMILVLAWLIHPASLAWSSMGLPIWLRWMGVALGIATGGLLVWVFRSLGQNITDTVVTRRDHTLVTTGPYRWVRHPFYLAFLMAVISDSVVINNWLLAVTGGILFCIILIRTRKEEENLLARFGDDYRDLIQTRGKIFPRPGRRTG